MNQFPFEKIKREILVKNNIAISCQIERTTNDLIDFGIVNIDKPSGPTSHQVSDYVKRILGIKKAGHSGTLDPRVTGVLPIALGRATRIVQALLPAGKEYIALMYLHERVESAKIRAAFKEFTGRIRQRPPVKSAVRRVERTRHIYYMDIMEIEGQNVLFKVGCEAGTYIRTLCHQIGKRLGCGAHMAELRRTRVAGFDESTLVTLHDLTDAFYYFKNGNDKFLRKIIQPMENGVSHLPKVWVLDTTLGPLSHGRDLAIPGIVKIESEIGKDDIVAIMSLKNELIAMGTALMDSKEIMKKQNGIAVRTDKVFAR